MSSREDTTRTVSVKVNRIRTTCARCGAEEIQCVEAYSPEAYTGAVCGPCILAGQASDTYAPEHPAMRPMVFVARALVGEEPYATLLRQADAQKKAGARGPTNPRQTAHVLRQAVAKLPGQPRNRRERRVAEARARHKPKKTRPRK